MREYTQFYINGQWVDPVTPKTLEVLDPSTEEPCATISLGTEADVDRAVAAAKAAFETFSQTSVEERVAMLERMAEIFKRRIGEIAEAIRLEMGAPIKLASTAQAYAGLGHITEAAKILQSYAFSEDLGPHPGGQGAHRGLRADHALELAAESGELQGRAGTGGGMYDGVEAQ